MSTLLDSEFQCWIGESGIPAANVNHTIRGQDCEPAKGAAGIAPAADGGYALSPMQSGMLYEALLHPESGYNVEQLQITLTEPLDAEVFRRAFTRVANHVPVLATAFEWEGLAKPVQRVHAGVDVPLVQLELSENAAIRTRELESFLEADRARGFDLRQPPLMRLALFGASSARPQLVWTFHHILLDGRSFPAILDLVFRTYAALRRGEPSPECSAPTRPYADFIRWLDQRDPERSAEFFRALWQGRSAPTPLPAAEPTQRPLPRHGSGRAHFQLGPSALDGLIALARDTGTSVATVVQAAWGLTLARFTGCDDVVFGSARACRRSALDGSAEDMLGLFMNTLPVRACLSAGRSVRELLLELRAQSLAMREHEHCPLTDVQRFCGLSGSAMFETMLMFEHRSLKASLCAIDRASWQPRELILHERPSLPLTAIVVQEATLDIDLLFDSTRFTVGAVERIGEAFCVGLVALARDPERRVAELDVLSAKQRKQILKDWNDTSRPFPNQLRIHQLFEARVALQPDAVALEFEGETLSYRELEAGANRLAHLLRARGAAPGRYIGVCLERGFELVVALLGVAKSGAAYVPLDPDWPRERLAFMVQAAGLDCIVTERLHAASFDVPTLELDGTDQPRLLESSPEQPAALGDATDVCYAIFTSGSTGEPKGVVLTHRAVVNTLDWVNRSFAVGANDRLLFVTSPCFDLSVYDIFGALGAGARVVIASRALQHDPEALAAAIVDRQITIWDSAPPALAQLVAFFPTAPGEYALRCVMLSGDWIPLSLPDAVRRAFPRAEVKSLGGATEAAIWSNFFAVGPIDPRWTSVPYGRPIQNCRYHVLDVQLRPVPIGVPGDLYIGGTCLAQGYLNRSALTTERFIPDPFSIDPGARLYKTGDLARYFEDGELEFLGRSDFQVKIRGYRVELPEIEVALSALEGVREAVCSAYLDPSGQRSLVAYVLAEPGATLDDSQLKAQLRARLPDYMVPPVIMFLDAWPLSANGKLDRKALPSVTQVRQNIEHVAPRTDFEQRLAQVWETVLNRRPIGLHDNFFDLGGHSLLAVMLMSELKQQLGVRVPLSLILEAPTLEAFATRCSQEPRANEDESLLVELRPGGPQCFFFVHDGDGETLLYRNLAQQLPAGYAVYGIKPLSRPSIPIAHASLIELAACYVAQVRKRQPHGPYSFAGLCAGGVIAFEMARQLHAAGEETDLLVIMDAAAPTAPVRPFLSARRRLKRTYHRVRGELFPPDRTAEPDRSQSEIRGFAPPPDDAKPLQPLHRSLSSASRKFAARAANTMRYELRWREQARSLRERFEMLRSIAQHGGDWPASVPALRAREIYEQLRDAYVPLRTPIKRPVLVKASLGEGADEAAQQLVDCDLLGWGEHIDGPIEVIDAPRGHSTMLQGGPGRLIGHHLQRLLAPDDDSLAVAPRNSVSVLVITVSYKTAALVERSLHALDRERAECPQLDLRAYVIDNASGDAPQLRAAVARHGWADWVTIAESPRNGGFAYGNNEGFRHAYREGAAPDYFLMLNPDAEIHPGAVRVLCDFLETRPDAAAAGSQLFFDDGNAWPYAFRFPSFWSEIEEGLSFGPTTRLLRNRTVRRRMGDVPEHVDWLPGASMLVRRTAIDQLGGLDERYFLYFEELDFCLKLTRAGWKCWYVPESRVTHISGQSTGVTDRSRRAAQLPAYWYQSRRRFFAKNHGLFYATSTDALSLVAHAVGRFKRQLAGKGADNIDNWFPDFVAHTVLRPRNQEVLPAIEFELEQLSEHAAPRAIRSARWAPFALNNLKRIRKRPAARS
jgi:amino acid adenylation domain-containing protein